MRALTVRQPWAWAIVHGGKDVENRTRNVAGSYRGPVAIHAGQQFADGEAFADVERLTGQVPPVLVAGKFIGIVDLVDVHREAPFCCGSWGQHATPYGGEGGLHHLVLRNPRPLPEPMPAKGRLGLWTPGPDVLEQLQAVTDG